MLTSDRVLVPGEVVRAGTKGEYRAIAEAAGEPHRRRDDLLAGSPDAARPVPDAGRNSHAVAVLAHLTDLHVMDPTSPTRLEVLAPLQRDECWSELLGGCFRPQETLTAHAVADIAAVLGVLAGPATGRTADLGVVTGDNIDNTQANELAAYLAALEGGEVRPGSGTGRYEGVQEAGFAGSWFWQPEAPGADRFQAAWGFPAIAGFLDRASRPFTAPGLAMPWLACYGNHDALLLGTTRATPAMRALAIGGWKPTGPDPELDPGDPTALFLAEPEALLRGPGRAIAAHAGRAVIDRDEFLAAHFGSRSRPHGHGFAAPVGVAHYAYDVPAGHGDSDAPALRVVVLDTTHPAGHWEGSIDIEQLQWLDGELAAADADGRLVVLASHHATPSLINTYAAPPDPRTHPVAAGNTPGESRSGVTAAGASAADAPHPERLLAADLVAVLHRHPCVIAWLNGHHHRNRVVPHRRADGGFWEITTASIVDWPCQGRLVEIVDEGERLALVCTMVDLPAPARPDADPDAPSWCASMHRELAANQMWQHGGREPGSAHDRNVVLTVPRPHRRRR